MKLLRSTLPLALALAVALPTTAWAQGRGNANGNKHKNKHEQRVIVIDRDDDDDDDHDRIRILNRDRDRDRVVVRDRDRDRFVLRNSGRTIILDDDDFFWYPVRSDRGPSFCRSGAGHPVFGIQWCLQKGYGIGRPGAVFFWGDDVFLRDQTRVIVLRDRRYDADQAFWSAVVGQVLALVD
ncbi:MAG TPA: hypothetical protein VFH11_09790 [Gemmatimonadota bacterium]|nr:hypothetical protein [Gemmatimonadota bacterium]